MVERPGVVVVGLSEARLSKEKRIVRAANEIRGGCGTRVLVRPARGVKLVRRPRYRQTWRVSGSKALVGRSSKAVISKSKR